METKRCSKCGEVKELREFHKMASSPDGRHRWCKICARQQNKQYRQENKEKLKQYRRQYCQENKEKMRQYRQENKEKLKQYEKQYRQENREKRSQYGKQYYQENKEKISQYRRQYYQENKEKRSQYRRQYKKQRYHSDPLYRMIQTYRRRLNHAFEYIKQKKDCKSLESLGTTWEHFHNHIAQQFQPGMTWENFSEWHLDHIKPINLATNEKEAIELSHYTNLRPLWASENMSRPSDGSDLSSPWPRNP